MTLLLAVRRHRHQELATAHTTHTTHDAAERRVTELYTKAADHLGSDKAPVRLAGLYALEHLAQGTPAAPDDRERHLLLPAHALHAAAGGGRSGPATGRDPQEERQVRLTAQRILAAHLRHDGFADYVRQSSGSPRCPRSPGRT
ncbi:hypothetical protein [Nonomuraea sp. NPDC049646]|uniref:hypothetical protein n=1 Tax=unclassified Nonomuraea TaxID=2593643 RepID=UPI0037982BF7